MDVTKVLESAKKTVEMLAMVISLVKIAMTTIEGLFDTGTGKFKKEAVMEFVKEAIGEEFYAKIEALLGAFINLKAFRMFGSTGKDPQ